MSLLRSVGTVIVLVDILYTLFRCALMIYDPDEFWMTPILPNANQSTACDFNYVCQAMRAIVSLYSTVINQEI